MVFNNKIRFKNKIFQNLNNKINIVFIFCFFIIILLQKSKSFKYFAAYHLQSGEILLITEQRIKKLNLNTQE